MGAERRLQHKREKCSRPAASSDEGEAAEEAAMPSEGNRTPSAELLLLRVVMRAQVDIDDDVVRFCRDHLPENSEAFKDPRLELIIDDAKASVATDRIEAQSQPRKPKANQGNLA